MPTGARPQGAALSPDGDRLYMVASRLDPAAAQRCG